MSDGIIAVERSAGGRNRYCHYCSVNCKQTLYSICLHTIDYIKRGGHTNFDRCEQAILTNHCPAQAMREKEMAAGQALYFSEWIVKQPEPEVPQPISLPKIDKNSEAYKRGWNLAGKPMGVRGISCTPIKMTSTSKVRTAPTPYKPKEVEKETGDELMTMDVSQMVSDTLGATKPVAPAIKLDTSRLPGETTLAYINRIKAMQSSAHV